MHYLITQTNVFGTLAVVKIEKPSEIISKVSIAVKLYSGCKSIKIKETKSLKNGFRLQIECAYDGDIIENKEIELSQIAVY